MSLNKKFLKVASVALLTLSFAILASCGKDNSGGDITTYDGAANTEITTVMEDNTDTAIITDTEVTMITDGADVVYTTFSTGVEDETEPETESDIILTTVEDAPVPEDTVRVENTTAPVTTVADELKPVVTTVADDPKPVVTSVKEDPVVDSDAVPESIVVGYGTKTKVYNSGDEEYEYIFSAIKKRGEGQIFEGLAYDYGDSIDELKRTVCYVEFRFNDPVSFTVKNTDGETEFSECGEIVFVLTGELNKCFVVKGRAPMEGMKQDIALVEYVQKLVK